VVLLLLMALLGVLEVLRAPRGLAPQLVVLVRLLAPRLALLRVGRVALQGALRVALRVGVAP
jgi:hypothetical protein